MKTKEKKMRQGIYLLPNLFTSVNLFMGFYAIIMTFKAYSTGRVSYYVTAAYAVVIGTIADTLDGWTARLTKTTSSFGLEYDSLADLTTFGLAPALMMYSWGLKNFGNAGWLAVFLYFACIALRLARFNVQAKTVERENFQGMPSPAAAGFVISLIMIRPKLTMQSPWEALYILFLPYLLALLLVSNIKYRNFKEANFRKRFSFSSLLVIVAFIIIIVYLKSLAILVIFTIYASSGIIETFFRFIFRRKPETVSGSDKSLPPQNLL